ncbi:MAG TPA: Stp1/IreP family PP2C-type Ser/Thr phosphatase [Actinomycetes bacterium]|nr:Stp1/IreP family PP2C-type Ser/Thr phosphatase [Actinomycetes bacterium]
MTDMGRMRKNNEDRYLVGGRLAAVADGMGGHRAGEVASAIAMEELAALEHAGPWHTPAEAGEALRAVFLAANRRIRETAAKDSEFEGMGTTLVALLEDGDSVHLANVGDSRAYLLRKGELSQVTIDHTLVQELIDEGRLRPDEAERHPQRSIITRALGVESEVEVDLFTYKLLAGDRLLLCSDGLSGVVDEHRIRNVLLRVPQPQRAAEKLVAMANEGGGPDNITVVVLDTVDRLPPTERTGDLGTPTGALAAGRGGATSEMLTGFHGRAVPSRDGIGSRAGRRQAARPAPRGAHASRHSRRRGLRRVLVGLLVLAVLAAIVIGGRALVFSRYWVGFDHDQVAVFSGVPGDVAGLRLSRVVERTGISRDRVAAGYAARLEEGVSASSLADARRIAACSPYVFTQQGCATGSQAAPTTAVPTTTRPATSTTRATATTAKARG